MIGCEYEDFARPHRYEVPEATRTASMSHAQQINMTRYLQYLDHRMDVVCLHYALIMQEAI